MTWRAAKRDEIQTYYREEFGDYIDSLPEFITPDSPSQWALAFRERYPVVGDEPPPKNFIRRSTRAGENDDTARETFFREWDDVQAFLQAPDKNDPLRDTDAEQALADSDLVDQQMPVPAAFYFGVNTHDYGWPVYIDIDAKDIARDRAEALVDSSEDTDTSPLEEAEIIDSKPAGYKYEYQDIRRALEYAFTVKDLFHTEFNAEHVLVLYSGQGAHVYLLDNDRAHRYDAESRKLINIILTEQYDIPVDTQNTSNRRGVGRVPYSLHADVSRIVTPIDSPDFDFRSNAIPEFVDETPTPPEP